MKQKIAIIGASAFQNPLILKAKEKGYETHVFAWKAGDVGERTADVFYDVSITEKDEILEICQREGISGICSIGSDLACLAVSYVAEKMGLTANSIQCSEISTNKYKMRQAFLTGNDPIPGFMEGDESTQAGEVSLRYPLIVKPTDRSGSRGVTRVETPEALKPAIEAALQDSFEKKVMIEEYIGGQEYSVECVSWEGKHSFLALTQKWTTGSPHFIETGHYQPAEVSEECLKAIRVVVFHALDSLGIRYGASHSEIKVMDGDIRIIEIGGRMGGDCIGSHLVPVSTGMDFVGMAVDIACGQAPDFTLKRKPEPVAIRFIFGEKDKAQYAALKATRPQDILITDFENVAVGSDVVTDSSNRHGFYIYRGDWRI